MATLPREFEMVWLALAAQDNSVETRVILETVKELQTEAITIKSQQRVEIVTGPCDSKYRRLHACLFLCDRTPAAQGQRAS